MGNTEQTFPESPQLLCQQQPPALPGARCIEWNLFDKRKVCSVTLKQTLHTDTTLTCEGDSRTVSALNYLMEGVSREPMGLKEPDSATLGAPILDTQRPDSVAEGVDGEKIKK